MCLPSCDRPGTPGLPHLLNILWRACVRVCARVCVCVCVWWGGPFALFSLLFFKSWLDRQHPQQGRFRLAHSTLFV